MGRILVPLRSDDELDRPDLNKCPDCMCFFGGNNCPLCGKECPEEMRAGNRKAVKKKKRRRGDSSGRVTFVEWYHSWWFIILMLFFWPLVGIILLATSPHKRSQKVTVIAIAVVYTILSTFGIGTIVQRISNIWDKPVDTSLSREEYIAACEIVTPEAFYRSADSYTDQFVTMTLTVTERIVDSDGYYSGDDYTTYYVCSDAGSDKFTILVRDCIQDRAQNFMPGDVITVYGQGAGDRTVYDETYTPHTAPCIHVAYVKSADSSR